MTNSELDVIREWLNTKDGEKVIDNIARCLLKDNRFKQFFDYFKLNTEYFISKETHNSDIDTLKSELVIFILQHSNCVEKTSDPKLAAARLKHSFINYCRDRTRNLNDNAFAYMIKYIGDVLRESEKIKTSAVAYQGTWFSNTDTDSKVFCVYDHILDEIPFPMEVCGSIDFDRIRNSASIIELAVYFAKSVSAYQKRPVLVGLNDFVCWLEKHVSISSIKEEDGEEENKKIKKKGKKEIEKTEKIYGQYIDCRSMLKIWAEKFFNQLDPMQKKFFYLKYCREKTLSEIADDTGFKSPSGVSYHLEEIKEKLKFFLSNLPMVSPETDGFYDEDAFLEFIEYLKFFLKKQFEKS